MFVSYSTCQSASLLNCCVDSEKLLQVFCKIGMSFALMNKIKNFKFIICHLFLYFSPISDVLICQHQNHKQ